MRWGKGKLVVVCYDLSGVMLGVFMKNGVFKLFLFSLGFVLVWFGCSGFRWVKSVVIVFFDEEAFVASQEVTLSSETVGAVIFYTLDGRYPTVRSKFYEGSFEINETITVRGIAVKNDFLDSLVTTVTFVQEKIPTPSVSPDWGAIDFSRDIVFLVIWRGLFFIIRLMGQCQILLLVRSLLLICMI